MILQETSLSYNYPTTQGFFKFTVSANKYGSISVSNVSKDNISFSGSYPLAVQKAINEAISKLEFIMSNISTLTGSINLNNQSEATVNFDTPMPNAGYRVVFSIDDFLFVRVKNRTTTGFTFELSTVYTGELKYDIIV